MEYKDISKQYEDAHIPSYYDLRVSTIIDLIGNKDATESLYEAYKLGFIMGAKYIKNRHTL